MYFLIPENQQFQPTSLLTKWNKWFIILARVCKRGTFTNCFESSPFCFPGTEGSNFCIACTYPRSYRNPIKCRSDSWQTPYDICILRNWINNKQTKLKITEQMKKYLKHWRTSSVLFCFSYLKASPIFHDLDHLLFWYNMAVVGETMKRTQVKL